MIVLDTNQLDRHALDSPYMAILKVLGRLTNNKLAVSEVTYNEHCAHYENQLRRLFAQQHKTRKEISGLIKYSGREKMSWYRPSDSIPDAATKHRESYQKKVLEIFDLITLDGPSAVEALHREAWRIPPASTSFDAKGSGARDAAIWLSLVTQSVELSETIYFISSDKQAFSSPEISADLARTGAHIVVMEDIGELLKILADDVDVAVDASLIRTSEMTKKKALDYVAGSGASHDFMDAARRFSSETALSCLYGDQGYRGIEFLDAYDLHGHVIGHETWVTGRVRWRVFYSITVDYKRHADETEWVVVPDELWEIAFEVSSVLIFKASGDRIEEAEMLNIGRPSQITNAITRFT